MNRAVVFGMTGAFLVGACAGLAVDGLKERSAAPPPTQVQEGRTVPAGAVFVIRITPEVGFRGEMYGQDDYIHEYGFDDPEQARITAGAVKDVVRERFAQAVK